MLQALMNLMKCFIFKKAILFTQAVLIFTVSVFTGVQAEPRTFNDATEKYPLFWSIGSGDFEVWTDGLRFNANRSGNMLEATLVSAGFHGSDYATVYLYKNERVNLTRFGEVYFRFHNLSDKPLKMNFTIQFATGEEYSVTSNMPILALPVDAAIKEIIPSEWGAVEIPPGFIGDIHVPGYKVKSMEDVAEDYISYGISFTIPKDDVHRFLMSDIRLVPVELSSSLYGFEIVGDSDIQMPVVGEAMAQYTVDFSDVYLTGVLQEEDFEVKFGLEEELEGVSITEDGRLIVRNNFETRHFSIYADINGELRGYKSIEVYDHWSAGLEHGDIKVHLPRTDEVASLKTNNPLFHYSAVYILRAFLIIVALVVSGSYVYWRKTIKEVKHETE